MTPLSDRRRRKERLNTVEGMTEFEEQAAANGFTRIAGVDEAGRGSLAGPIVAAAVILDGAIPGLNDSKQLTASQREFLFERLHEGGHCIGIGCVGADEIDLIGIQGANYKAMAEAVLGLEPPPDFLLVDGFAIKGCALPQAPIVKGDARSASIAAASIVAKVTRDRIMVDLDPRYPHYHFKKNKGYGTQVHIEAINRFGPAEIHRKSFAPIARAQETGPLFL